jgi:hypothetical protein
MAPISCSVNEDLPFFTVTPQMKSPLVADLLLCSKTSGMRP